jgi:hypothetical protein
MSDNTLSFALSRAIKAGGEEVTELSFREPNGADILNVGNPVVIDMASDPPRVTHDERKMRAMISRLAAIPTSSVDQLSPQDWVGCAWALTPFFVPAAGTI